MTASSATLVTPFELLAEYLASQGALVEGGPDRGLALVPTAVAAALGIGEELRVAEVVASPGETACGFGSPLLDTLLGQLRTQVPLAEAKVAGLAPSDAACSAALAHFVPRNAVADVVGVARGQATYVAAFFTVTAEADDRYETVLRIVADAATAAEPETGFADFLDPGYGSGRLLAADAPLNAVPTALHVPNAIIARAQARAASVVAGFRASVHRRRDRDRERIGEYFDSLVADTQASRRTIATEVRQARVDHLQAERERMLADLDTRYAVRLVLAPAAIVRATAAVARVTLRIRRRKVAGSLVLQIPADTRHLDRLPCAGCAQTTLRPVFCDDHLHVLCEACAPSAQGRPRCPAC
jgi:hypothetical protein